MADYPSQYTSIHDPAFQYSSGITSLGVHVVYYHYAPSPYSQVHFTVRMCIKTGTYLTETPLTVPAQCPVPCTNPHYTNNFTKSAQASYHQEQIIGQECC